MPSLKMKNFSGIATNFDQDDININLMQRCRNGVNKQGYIKNDETKLKKHLATTETNGIPITSTRIPNPKNFYDYTNQVTAVSSGPFLGSALYSGSTNTGKWTFDLYWSTAQDIEFGFMSDAASQTTMNGYTIQINSVGGVQLNYVTAGVQGVVATGPVVTASQWYSFTVTRSATGEFSVDLEGYDSFGGSNDSYTNVSYYNINMTSLTKFRRLTAPLGTSNPGVWVIESGGYTIEEPVTSVWLFSKGLELYFSEDRLSKEYIQDGVWARVLLARGYTSIDSTYHYQIWLRTDSDTTWREMSLEGNYTPDEGQLAMPTSFLRSELTGEMELIEANGVLKIHLPHDSFWLGKINRTYKQPLSWGSNNAYNGFYLDRLSEDVDLETVTVSGPGDNIICTSDRRLGCKINAVVNEVGTQSVEAIEYTANYLRSWNNGEKGRGRIYEFLDSDGNKLSNQNIDPIPISYAQDLNLKNTEFPFFEHYTGSGYAGTYLVSHNDNDFSPSFAEVFAPIDNSVPATPVLSDWATAPYSTAVTDPDISDPSNNKHLPGIYRSLGDATLIETGTIWAYNDGKTISNVGFSSGPGKANIIATAVLDEVSEIIIDYKTLSLSHVTEARFGISIDLDLPSDINKRITRVNTYVKLDEDKYPDYELAGTYDLLSSDEVKWTTGWMDEYSLKGTTLAQNIAFLIDEDELYQYKLFSAFYDSATLDGITLATIPNDNMNVYYSVVGGGRLQPDIIYKANILEDIPRETITAVTLGNNFFVISTLIGTYVVKATAIGGIAAFTSQKTLDEGTPDKRLTAYAQGGAITAGLNGIYFLDGYTSKHISLNVDNLVEEPSYPDKLYYNNRDHIVFFIKQSTAEILRYRIKDDAWETLYLDNDSGFALAEGTDIFADRNGRFVYLMVNKMFDYDSVSEEDLVMELISNHISLDQTGTLKRMNDIIVDYEGDFVLTLYLDGRLTQSWNTEWMRRRDQKTLPLKMISMRPFTTMLWTLTTDRPTTLYEIVFNFDYLWDREWPNDPDDRSGAYLIDSEGRALTSSTGDYLIASDQGTE